MDITLIDLISAAGTAVLALIAVALGFLISWIKTKTDNALINRAVAGVSEFARLAVQEVWVGYVEALKKDPDRDGKLSEEERVEARERAVEIVKSYLGAKGIAALLKALGIESEILDSFVGAQVEQALVTERRAAKQSEAHGVASDPMPASAQA